MSTDRSQRRAQRQFRIAEEIVRSILDDPTANVSPSNELYRAIERRFHTLGGNNLLGPASTSNLSAASSTGGSAASMASSSDNGARHENEPTSSFLELHRRFSREPRGRDSITSISNLLAEPFLPPLRSHTRVPGIGTTDRLGTQPRRRPQPSDRLPEPSHPVPAVRMSGATMYRPTSAYSPALAPAAAAIHQLESPEENNRAKRRKVESDQMLSDYKGFRYGRYGQVEPGRLNMEIVSCDGGLFSEGAAYAAVNILKNDNSVYCTKDIRCNIVLQHQGATVFNLTELIIVQPDNNYSAPVREGMVFVSMEEDDLLKRTAKYQIQYKRRQHRVGLSERETRPLIPVLSVRHNADGSVTTRSQRQARRAYSFELNEDEDDYATAQLPSEFAVTPPPFQVTTECSNDEARGPSQQRPRYQRARYNPAEWTNTFEPWLTQDRPDDFGMDEVDMEDDAILAAMRSDADSHGEHEDDEDPMADQEDMPEPVTGELMAPHAKFYIEKDKNRCSIRFDPPVSGRYILLKMWNPQEHHVPNIDIQGVVAVGYAGPRYFPSVDLR